VFLFIQTPLSAAGKEAAADPKDVESVDSILKAVYGVISGAAGEERDWDRFRSLFIPEARLISASPRQDSAVIGYRVMTPEDYISRAGSYLESQGFYEQEIHRSVDGFGPIVQVFSTYESRHRSDDREPFARGINSFQLLNDGKRWWVVTIYWTSERPDLPIPARYLTE